MNDGMPPGGLANLELEIAYDSADHALHQFYVPCLERAVSYDRSVGYFRASALSVAARGVSRFIAGGGTMRLLAGAEVAEKDVPALTGATEIPPVLATRLADALITPDEVAAQRLEVLAWLVREGRLEVRVAVALDPDGRPIPTGEGVPYFHEKFGILRDARGAGVVFHGSINESAMAWTKNFESFSVYTTWGPSGPYYDHWVRKFEERWAGHVRGFRVYKLPDAARERLLSLAPQYEPPSRDAEEPPSRAPVPLLARVLRSAPRAVGGERTALATTGVRLFPHQEQVVRRLAGQYPRSWLVADEVGLGKTISAGTALRQLLLTGQVQKVLILAPANVCRQWQDELFEKFGLWVPRLEGQRIHGAHPDDARQLASGENPYSGERVLIASSHTARRVQHLALIEAAGPFDLLILDEAHHARRRSFHDLSEYRPTRLLSLLDRLVERDLVRALWMLTATPMQVHPVELRDLVRHLGIDGPLRAWEGFSSYYTRLAQSDADTDWAWLAWAMGASSPPEPDEADRAVLDRIAARLGPVAAARIRDFQTVSDPKAAASDLGLDGRRELRAWLRHRGPVGRAVTRHTRATLKRYRLEGLLDEPIADRDVKAVPIGFSAEEQEIYDGLDELIDRLMSTHEHRQGAGFVLTVYRRRLTSSWAAIRSTLRRRITRERRLASGELEEEFEVEVGTDEALDDLEVVPLGEDDLREVERFLTRMDHVSDSKFDRLRRDLDEARGSGRSMIVFTQFVDTLEDLRDRLVTAYEGQLATYTGDGGRIWRPEDGWVQTSKQQLVDAIRSGRITVLLATDAASEGINLQACSSMINFDLPWNPMRVEQRIGRIDRIGQQRPIITVRNYVIPGTVEERVYSALADRIDDFAELLGNLQPILGQTEQAFQRIFRAPRSERQQAIASEIKDLDEKIKELRTGGIDLELEDPMPIPSDDPAFVDLETLGRSITEDLGLQVGEPGRPVTPVPESASRDASAFAALLTYGHPQLDAELDRLAADDQTPDIGPLVIARHESGVEAIARGDRSPAQLVLRIEELDDLGEPVAMGEAADLARRAAEAEASARALRREQWLGRSEERWRAAVRARFVGLVQRVIGLERELAARNKDLRPDPVLVWHGLGNDRVNGWAYAEAFRVALQVDVVDLLTDETAEIDASASGRELQRRRVQLGRELLDLMSEWRGRTHSKTS